MLGQEKQVAIFVEEINRKAAKECKRIEKETKKLYTLEAEKLQKAAETNMEKRLAYAKAQALTNANKSVAKNHAACRKSIAEKRKEIENRVFDRVKENLSAFAGSDTYEEFLKKSLLSIAKYGDASLTLFVKAEDTEKVRKLVGEMGMSLDVKEDRSILIGGIKAQSEKRVLDDTLDARLEEQKESFYSESGLIADF